MEFFQNIIPTSLLCSLTEGNVLQTLFVALLVGFGLQAMGPSGEPVLRGIGLIQKLVFRILAGILWLAPIGAFGAMAKVVGDTGFDAVVQLAVLMLAFYLTCSSSCSACWGRCCGWSPGFRSSSWCATWPASTC